LSPVLNASCGAQLQADLSGLRILHVLLGLLLRKGYWEESTPGKNAGSDFFKAQIPHRTASFSGGANVALRMTDREVGGVSVLDIEGRIVLGEESNAFREKVKGLLAAGKKKIILNLAQVGYIDSAGLGTLVATFHSARSQGATLKLTNLGSKFKEVLQVTKLMTVFDTYDTEAAAIASFPK
jgi:anti-sigma B factor antagonist